MIKRFVSLGNVVLVIFLMFALSACRQNASIPSPNNLNEIQYKGHIYIVSQTSHSYSVIAHAGHCGAEHK